MTVSADCKGQNLHFFFDIGDVSIMSEIFFRVGWKTEDK